MFPTILSAMGCTIKGDRLGFGVNLFGTEKTLCEKYSEEYINTKLMERNRQYEEMDYTPEERK
jgi:phosphoglycerol transferase